MAAKPKSDEKPIIPMVAGAIYEITDMRGHVHTCVCQDVVTADKKKIGVFQLRGYALEEVVEGSERGQQFKLILKPRG